MGATKFLHSPVFVWPIETKLAPCSGLSSSVYLYCSSRYTVKYKSSAWNLFRFTSLSLMCANIFLKQKEEWSYFHKVYGRSLEHHINFSLAFALDK